MINTKCFFLIISLLSILLFFQNNCVMADDVSAKIESMQIEHTNSIYNLDKISNACLAKADDIQREYANSCCCCGCGSTCSCSVDSLAQCKELCGANAYCAPHSKCQDCSD
jgi:hypothetical protein